MSITEKIKRIDGLLQDEYGRKTWKSQGDPLSVLISTMLSQNTSDGNSHRSFTDLRKVFKSWKQVEGAPVSKIARTIRSGGLANVKARRIKDVLSTISFRNGNLDLSFLKKWKEEKIKSYLKSLRGVGDKTVACVLLFSLGKSSMPVDTHVFRVSKRLGLLPFDADFKMAHALLEKAVPPGKMYQFHTNLIAHGRAVCKARGPRCETCVLHSNCKKPEARSKN